MYEPNPIDTSGISLSEYLQPMVEKLAEHVHEVWALQRFGDGWIYGETRDDEKKTHPDLMPYDQLSEVEKEYDRRTVEQTIFALLAMGASIQGGVADDGSREAPQATRSSWLPDALVHPKYSSGAD